MWKITVAANPLLMVLFWILGEIAIAPAYNHFVRYPDGGGGAILPVITQVVLNVRGFVVVLPVIWGAVAVLIFFIVKRRSLEERSVYLQGYTLMTLLVGMSLIVIYGLAGMLPYLKIGSVIS